MDRRQYFHYVVKKFPFDMDRCLNRSCYFMLTTLASTLWSDVMLLFLHKKRLKVPCQVWIT